MKNLNGLCVLTCLFFSSLTQAEVISSKKIRGYHVTLEKTYDSEETPGFAPDIPSDAQGFFSDGSLDLGQIHNDLGSILQIGKDIVAIGELVYSIIEKGKPIVNIKYSPISVLPKDPSGNGDYVDVFSDMENWSLPIVKKFKVSYKNFFQTEVVKYEYTLIFSYNGSYKGAGKYITGAQIIPASVQVLWGFGLDSEYKLINIANMGSKTNPLAMATVELKYKIRPAVPLQAIDQTISISITGDGQVQTNY